METKHDRNAPLVNLTRFLFRYEIQNEYQQQPNVVEMLLGWPSTCYSIIQHDCWVNYVFILAEIEIYLLGNHIAIKLLLGMKVPDMSIYDIFGKGSI